MDPTARDVELQSGARRASSPFKGAYVSSCDSWFVLEIVLIFRVGSYELTRLRANQMTDTLDGSDYARVQPNQEIWTLM